MRSSEQQSGSAMQLGNVIGSSAWMRHSMLSLRGGAGSSVM
jgi:hypothetical protein